MCSILVTAWSLTRRSLTSSRWSNGSPRSEPADVAGQARRLAVVLFNLGGPDSLKAVRPFLFNLFADPAIIDAPAVVRLPLAGLISSLRARSAQANYARMGGASPLLKE